MNELSKVTAQTITDFVNMIKSMAPQIWATYQKQTILSAWIDIVSISFAIIAVGFIGVYLFKKQKDIKVEDKYSETAFWFFILSICCAIVCFLWFAFVFPSAIKPILNPEYYTIQSLANDMLKR